MTVKTGEKTAPKAAAQKTTKPATTARRTITIRLKRSTISCPPIQRATVNGLGLRRLRQERTLENTSSVRGMIKKVLHLVEVVSETR